MTKNQEVRSKTDLEKEVAQIKPSLTLRVVERRTNCYSLLKIWENLNSISELIKMKTKLGKLKRMEEPIARITQENTEVFRQLILFREMAKWLSIITKNKTLAVLYHKVNSWSILILMESFQSIHSRKSKETKNQRVQETVKSKISLALWKLAIETRRKQEITSLMSA